MSTKQDYDFYKSIGICVRCHKEPAEPERIMCAACLEKERKRAAENRAALKKMRFCPRCGQNKLFGDEKMCLDCREKMYEYNKDHRTPAQRNYIKIRKEAGLCIKCGKRPPVNGKTKCEICDASERIRAREYRMRKGIGIDRSERISEGRCYFCGYPVLGGMKVCGNCRERCANNLDLSGGNDYWRKNNKLIFAGKVK